MGARADLLKELERIGDQPSRLADLEGRRGEMDERFFEAFRLRVDELMRSDAERARGLALAGREAARMAGRPDALARAERALGYANHALGRYPDAVGAYERAIGRFAEAGLPDDVARTRIALVDALMYVSRYDDAIEAARAAREEIRGKDRARLLAKLDWNLGNVHHRADRYGDAIRCYERARRHFSSAGLAFQTAVLDFNRAVVLSVAGDPEKALLLFARARRVFVEKGLRAVTAQLDYNVAYLHFLRGRLTDALRGLDEVDREFDALGDRRHLALGALDRAEILLRLNLAAEAREHARAAAEHFADLGMRFEEGKARMFAAAAILDDRDQGGAQRELEAAARLFEAEDHPVWAATSRLLRAEADLRAGRPGEAEPLAAAAREVFVQAGIPSRTAWADLVLGAAAAGTGRTAAAEALLRPLTAPAAAAADPGTAFRAHRALGRLLAANGRREEAEAGLRRAAEIVEEMRSGIGGDELRAAFLADKVGVYEDLVLACLDRGDARDALSWVERAKSRALADILDAGPGAPAPRHADPEEMERLRRLREELGFLYNRANEFESRGDQRSLGRARCMRTEIERVRDDFARLLRRIEVANPGLAPGAGAGIAVGDDGDLAPSGTTLLEYFTAGSRILLFVVRDGEVRPVEIRAPVERVLGDVERLSFQLAKFNLGPRYVAGHLDQLGRAADSILAALHRDLLEEALALAGADRLVVVPHGPLHGVPFHALRGPDGPVIADREVTYAPSAQILRRCRRRPARGPGPALLVGLEDERTPSIREEIDGIRGVLPGSRVLRNRRATKASFLREARDARVIHLATHGVFREDHPALSALRLADSWFGLHDAYGLETNAELVTLSACESGLSRVHAGDELFGLARGFFAAGAPTILASLWRVDDESTARFMRTFYAEWGAGRSPSAAARTAALRLREEHSHPYYWAPFVILGRPERGGSAEVANDGVKVPGEPGGGKRGVG